jgi:predicted dehydrogenase
MRRGEKISRREFLAGATALTAVLASGKRSFAFVQGSDTLKFGLIGCGARGTGAMVDAFNAGPGVVLWAMGDVFEDRLRSSQEHLKGVLKDAYQVGNRSFLGFDAYKEVITSGVDVVILTAPPAFRPAHFRFAVENGKHVFMEKPIATDAPGVRSVMESSDLATAKRLCVVAGTQRRHDVAYREAIQRIQDKQIGDVVALYCYWNQGGLWMVPRKPEWTDLEWQLRNWLYFTWLAGDHIVEQHIHNIDVCNWVKGEHPVKAMGVGGRQVRTDPAYGHIYDHFAIEFEYADGVKMLSMCRQQDGTSARVGEHVVGTRGTSNANTYLKGEKPWEFKGERPNPYVLEHRNLLTAIRGGRYINEGRQVAESTLTAIMGRMAAYTGLEVTWEQAYNSQESLVPEKLEFGPMPVPPVAMPGKTILR